MWVQPHSGNNSLHVCPVWGTPSTCMHWESPTQPSVGLKASRHPVHHAWRSDLVRSAAPDTPSSSARPAGHQQDWERGVQENTGETWGQVWKEMRTSYTGQWTYTVENQWSHKDTKISDLGHCIRRWEVTLTLLPLGKVGSVMPNRSHWEGHVVDRCQSQVFVAGGGGDPAL